MKYTPALDGIRAFAVLLVMLFHTAVPFMNSGYLGVDMFFVLSGFIITTLLMNEHDETGHINLPFFYLRRIFRLYPALLLLLLLVLLGFWGAMGVPPSEITTYYRHAAIAALYLTDVALLLDWMPKTSIIMHTWSIAIEEHYYIVWPFVLLLLCRSAQKKHLAKILGALFLLSLAWKAVGCVYFKEYLYLRFDYRISGLILGGFMAAFLQGGGRIPDYKIPLAVFFALFLFCLWTQVPRISWSFAFGVTVTEIFTALMIYAVMTDHVNAVVKFLGSAVPAYLGRISYGLYLYHYPIAAYAIVGRGWTVALPVTVVLTLVIASLSYFLLERPALEFAKRYRTRHRQPDAAN